MGKKRESAVERDLCDHADSFGVANQTRIDNVLTKVHVFEHRKFSSPGHANVPDQLMAHIKYGVFMVEVKRPGEVPTPAQTREKWRWEQAGVPVYAVDNTASAKALLNYIDAHGLPAPSKQVNNGF